MKLFKDCTDGHHKFEARYDIVYNEIGNSSSSFEGSVYAYKEMKEIDLAQAKIPKSKTYIYDICIKCGKVVNK